eukprot:TRINITY_DN6200_c0_g1_i1.p1 TRINITY_DN6200_c0_g1~~TRINITY_DN6200_c0_g1_i1.p1  ORF type:complete len:655 (+),score=194.66 TRINITY_DN6200_c0_g1_i1:35-1999(+)
MIKNTFNNKKFMNLCKNGSNKLFNKHPILNNMHCRSTPLIFRQSKMYSVATDPTKFRNIAIIAHIDHGKTTLVDELLQQSGVMEKSHSNDRVMDSNQLEKERGITILAKTTQVSWKGHTFNIVDTPGHGDFGGEVERIVNMVDGVVLLVDGLEGPMAQTKFVLSKALKANLKPIVVLNKMDRDSLTPERVDECETEIFDLFSMLDATYDQCAYPTFYASARNGWASKTKGVKNKGMTELLDTIIEVIPPPKVDVEKPFSLLVNMLDNDPYQGRILIGKVESGKLNIGDEMKLMKSDGKTVQTAKITKIYGRKGIMRTEISEAVAGDIVGLAGFESGYVTDTIAHPSIDKALPAVEIDPPVISMTFSPNKSPFNGREGKYFTSQQIKARLQKEVESNVALKLEPSGGDSTEVKGRGELQMGVLIENMRREGFELEVSPPTILYKQDPVTGKQLEPIEEVIVDVDNEFSGKVIEMFSMKGAELVEVKQSPGKTRIIFLMPSRALIGIKDDFTTETRGTGIYHHLFKEYRQKQETFDKTRKGLLIASEEGVMTAYAIESLESRGKLFYGPGTKCYLGMVIGENNKAGDLVVNPVRSKQLTNFRTTQKDDFFRLQPPKLMSLENYLAYMQSNEILECTPKSIRLRVSEKDPTVRMRKK